MEIFYISTLVLVTQKYIFITKYTELLILGHSETYSIQMIPQYSCLLANGKQEQHLQSHLQSRTNFEHIFHLSSHCSSSSSFETLRPSRKVITGAQDPLPCAGEKLSSNHQLEAINLQRNDIPQSKHDNRLISQAANMVS